MSGSISRRRALRIVAGLAGVPLLVGAVRALSPDLREFRWRGEALGAMADVALWHHDEVAAKRALELIRTEIARYERKFSLFDSESEISRLNRDGELTSASTEFRELVSESLRLGHASGGAFDISVQPLWRLYEANFWSAAAPTNDILWRAHDVAREAVDFRRITIERDRVHFTKPGMAITLNGIAQGYLTDRVADLLRLEGFETAVIDLGEIRALGRHPDGRPWRIGVKNPGHPDETKRTLDLADMALAVSGGYGTTFDESGRFHHIFDPASGDSANRLIDVAVTAPRATIADGLATALCVTGIEGATSLLRSYPDCRAYMTKPDGASVMASAAGVETIV